MMNAKNILENFSGVACIWACPAEDVELARIAEYAVANNVGAISVAPDAVARVWPWLEKTGTEIYARFYMDAPAREYAAKLSDLCSGIRASFIDGADGAQIFIKHSDVKRFADELISVRDDLFFNKKLCVGIDITNINAFDWPAILNSLTHVRADAVIFFVTSTDIKHSTFIGALYGALDTWGGTGYDLQFALGQNSNLMDQGLRLVQMVRPELTERLRFWVRM